MSHQTTNFNVPTTPRATDPIRYSNRSSFPFPVEAASRLASERSKRYDDLFYAIEETELRLREFASIMGMFMVDDDAPTAA